MSHQTYLSTGLICGVLVAFAPAYAADPLSAGQKMLYERLTNNVIRAAEKMPEANYSFKPTPEVRSFGQLVGHLAVYQLCVLLRRGRREASCNRDREWQDFQCRSGASAQRRLRLLQQDLFRHDGFKARRKRRGGRPPAPTE